jgi:hypothetical protein
MHRVIAHPVREGSSEATPLIHDHRIRLDSVRHRKLIQLSAGHRLSPHDLVVKALDDYFANHLR